MDVPTPTPVPTNPSVRVVHTLIALDSALTAMGTPFPGGLAALALAVLPDTAAPAVNQ